MNKCDTCKCNKVCDHYHFGFENCENYISVDCVEVVRCKDCKYYIPDADVDHSEFPNYLDADGLCDNMLKYTDKMCYCSYGKRKGGAE